MVEQEPVSDKKNGPEQLRIPQKWEYTTIAYHRGIKGSLSAAIQAIGSNRNVSFRDATEWQLEGSSHLEEMGEQGWELVNVVPMSDFGGAEGAGFTTQLYFVFKRPKLGEYTQSLLRLSQDKTPSQKPPEETRESLYKEAKEFSSSARAELEKRGYIIYRLEGKSIRLMWKKRGKIDTILTDEEKEWGIPAFWSRTLPSLEVAINPNQLLYPNSNDKGFQTQQKMVAAFSEEISSDIKGVKAIIGEAQTYIELIFAHRDTTGQNLLEENADIISNTPYSDDGTPSLPGYKKPLVEIRTYGDELAAYPAALAWEGGEVNLWTMPLVVPD